MLISIIIPTLNSAKTIAGCIESILSQTHSNFEILIMDGVSTDNTLELANYFADPRIKTISQRDTGVYDAMNKGIDIATGEWLYFLGSDDKLYDEQVLEKIVAEVTNAPCDFIYGNALFIYNDRLHDGEFTRYKLFSERNICHQAIFFHKSIFTRLGKYNTDFFINADWDLNLRCFATPDLRIRFIDLPIARYNDRDGMSSSGGKIDNKFQALSGAILSYSVHTLTIDIVNLESSADFRLGQFILKPFRYILKLFR